MIVMLMGMAVFVEMLMVMGMLMIVSMDMIVGVGMGNTVVGMLVGVSMGMAVVMVMTGQMVVIVMHSDNLLLVFTIIISISNDVKTNIFSEISPG